MFPSSVVCNACPRSTAPPYAPLGADFIGQRGFRSMFEVAGALLVITLQQPLLALVSLAITPLLSRVLRAVVVRSSAIIYRRQQVGWACGWCGPRTPPEKLLPCMCIWR